MHILSFSFQSTLQMFRSPILRARSLTTLVLLLFAGAGYGGVEVNVVTIDHSKDPAQESQGVMLLDGGNLSMNLGLGSESEAEKGGNTTLFQAATQNFVVIDHGEKSYSVMDEETIQMIAEEMENAMLMLDQRMASLPVEQRKILRDSLAQGQAEEGAPNRVTNTGEVATKAGFATRKFVVHRGEELVREVWVADWQQIPETEDVKAALQGLEGFFLRLQKMFTSLSVGSLGGVKPFDMGDSPFQDLGQMNGFPVLTRNFEHGTLTTETRIESVKTAQLPDATFEPPKDYHQRKMNGGR